jgi:alpha-tubulin suppressor-like RCC1 family protein
MRRYALRKILLALIAAICCSRLAAQSAPPDAAQAVFVVSGGNQISEYTTSGVLVRTLSGGPSGGFRGLAFGTDGYLYATNTFTCSSGTGSCNELERFDPNNGAYLGAVGSITPNTNPYSGVTNQAVSLNGLALGPGNDLYVLTNQLGLYKIDPAANTTVPIPTADCCTLSVAFLPDGTTLSISSSQNTVTNDLSGAVFNTGSFTSAQSIAFGPDGRLYVLQAQEIDAVPNTGGAITQLTASSALGTGYFVAFDSQGHIWATDLKYGVREFGSATGQQIGGFASNKASAFAGIAIGSVFGNVWAWGDNGFGELGNGTTTASPSPAVVSNLSNVVTIADGCCDDEFGLGLKSDGTVWAWGANGIGELGNGTTVSSSTPVQVSGLAGVTGIAANWDHALAVESDGTVWAWGYNGNGELGNGITTNSNTPVQVCSPAPTQICLSNVIAVAAGDSESMALKSDGTVWVWGYNGNGQLGIGTTSPLQQTTPVQVNGLSGVLAIAAGNGNSLVLKGDGTVWGWGYNLDGRLGNGTTTSSTTPVQASGLSGVIAIAAGDGVSLALKSDGSVWAWGSGSLGNGTTAGSTIPVQVQSLSGMTAIAVGSNYSLALKSDSTVWAWGNNGSGQLGIGTTSPLTPVTTPVQVNNLSGVTAIAAGDIFSLAIQGQANAVATHFSVSAPASSAAGTSFNFSVTALDASNHPAAGYTGTVHFSSADLLAALPVDYTFTATDNGTHTSSATLNTAGNQTITTTDTANAAVTGMSGPITVSAAATTRFSITAPPSVTGGTPFSVTVTASDAFGNISTSYVGTVHFTGTDGLAILPTDYTFTAADHGTHVFTPVTLNTSGNQTITATDSTNATITGTSGPISVVVPLTATHFSVSAPASATVGTVFSVTVTALNAANQTSTNYTGTVLFSTTDAQAALPTTYTFTAADHGTHVFTVTLNTAGSQTISATDTPNTAITGTSAPISVTSAVPPPVQITDNETISVSDAESFPDVFDPEAVHVTDAVFVTPLITVTAPVAEFSAGGLGFGGQSGTQTITVSDIGQAPLTLASATISGGGQFNISQIACSNGATSLATILSSGGACILTINYAASATPANDNTTLVFNDNAELSNLPTAPSGASYMQSVPLSGGGANIAPPPPPPATVSVMDNEMVHVTDAESFPDVFDAEAVRVTDQVSIATLQTITVRPANSTIANGTTESFVAIGTFSDGSTQDLTGRVTWSSSNLAVATMNGRTATAVSLGQTTIMAALGSIAGSTSLTARIPFLRISAGFSSITRATNGGYNVTISVTNTGDITASSVAPALSVLGSALTRASTPATNLPPGATATVTVLFPSSAGTSGSTQVLFVLGFANGTDPNGTPAPPALWLLPPRQVTLP